MAWTVYITPHELFQNMKHARRAAKELAAYGFCWESHEKACTYVKGLYGLDYINPGEKVFIVKVPDND